MKLHNPASLPEGSASHTWVEHLCDAIIYFKMFYFHCLRFALDDIGASCQGNFPAPLTFKTEQNLMEININAYYALSNYTTIPLVTSTEEL